MSATKELVVRLPAELHAQVKERADSEERTISQTIRLALRMYLRTPTGTVPRSEDDR